ncbi:putative hydrolase of the HAD superfamily [Virgibacillus subterraneus]|uniref:Hydrolase of the HAD superfamily n=1 Tax=Virgibacillus subterraneus TaxID=621109 RepID=A0A1H9JW45_9BACI|nr:HAD family hydrolase [Virgibacillus subterraneus]SEQ91059.1 putative hydrolase of the HAD superfamily [Virgibacillus subterraneus]
MIKAALFDLDGTLLNRDESVKTFVDKQYERLDKWLSHVPKDKYIARFIELDNQGYVWKDAVYQQLVDDFNITGITWEELLQDYISQFKNCCIPFPNLINMLGKLRSSNLVLGMITNGKGQFQMDNIRALGIENYFETILISEWEGMKKPDPQIFNKALDKLNVSSAEAIFIGDNPEKDVKAAQNAGMKGIWKRDDLGSDTVADFKVDDLEEIPLIIRELNNNSLSDLASKVLK